LKRGTRDRLFIFLSRRISDSPLPLLECLQVIVPETDVLASLIPYVGQPAAVFVRQDEVDRKASRHYIEGVAFVAGPSRWPGAYP
jgi:hypothetical protein